MLSKLSQSLMDYLLQVMPELKGKDFKLMLRPLTKDPNAKKLYDLWSEASNKITERKFHRPPAMSDSDLRSLETSGMIEVLGDAIKVTVKGADVLRKMILDDNKFYLGKKASGNIMIKNASNNVSIANLPTNANNWYQRIKDANSTA